MIRCLIFVLVIICRRRHNNNLHNDYNVNLYLFIFFREKKSRLPFDLSGNNGSCREIRKKKFQLKKFFSTN